LDAHEKNAIMITAHASLKAGPRDMLHDMLFMHAGPGCCMFTLAAELMVRKGRSLRTVWRHLKRLAADDWIEIEPGEVRYHDGRPIRSPSTYRILTVAERHACQIGTILIPSGKIPPGTGASTEHVERYRASLAEAAAAQASLQMDNETTGQGVEILAPSEPIGADPAPIGSRLLLKNAQVNETRISAPSVNSGVPSDNHGFETEAAESQAPRQPDQIDRPHRRDGECQQQRPDLRPEGEKMRWNHPVCDPCSMPLRATHVLIRGAPASRVQFCGWCANRTESGLTVRCDPAGVPYPDNPADARCYVARFRSVALAGAVTMAGPRGPIRLDRMSDSEAVYAAGQYRLIARNVGRIARQRAAATPPVRRLGLS
jgi:hypothetical protein